MKVTFKGTAEELLDLAELLVLGTTSRHATGVPKNRSASARYVGKVQAEDDVPNRYREEGAQ